MHPLTPNEYHAVLPLADQTGTQYPIIRAVLENRQDGQVLADHRTAPTSAIVCHKFGFLTVLTGPDTSISAEKVIELLLHGQELTPQYRLWYDPGTRFMPLLQPHVEAGKARVRERIRYQFSATGPQTQEPPAGWNIRELEQRDLSALAEVRLGFPDRFWRSADDFFAEAFAVVAAHHGEIASICYPAAIGGNRAEIDVVTLERARGRPLGYAGGTPF